MERKIYAFGMDGFIVPMMKRFAAEGALPHFERFGPYREHASMLPYTAGMADFDTALEECEYQGMWFAEVARYMLRERRPGRTSGG